MSRTEVVSRKRIAILLLGTLILTCSLVIRVIYLQLFLAGQLAKSAEMQRFRTLPVLPRRGTIYDRLGNEMAVSIDGESVYIIPREVKIKKPPVTSSDTNDKAVIAGLVGKVLGVSQAKVENLLTKRAPFVWLKRKATFTEIDELRKLCHDYGIKGIEITQNPRRFYPQSQLASQVLGIVGIDNEGLEGLEKQYDKYLAGVPGSDQGEFDTAGNRIPQGERRYIPPVDGDSLVLTIDQNIQYIVERELDKAVAETASKRGMALVVDPKTGEILAISSSPRYDPNRFSEYPIEYRRNPLISDMYEPGSTFKVFTTVAAMEEGLVSPESTFFDPGFLVVDDRRIKCWKPGGHGSQNFIEALENSCNPVFATLALRMTKETFYNYIKAFGFGSLAGVDFPGETAGRLQLLSRVKNVELANIGFGQGISVTPLQMVMGVSAIANGGNLLEPRLVREIVSPEGEVQQKYTPRVIRRVCSKKTADLVCQLMQSVVTNGSGNRAYLEGYRVAGKTGTAQKVAAGVKGYSKLIASFIGFAPADDPKAVALVVLDEPGCSVKYGGVIAAPVVGNIFRDVLRYLGVKARYEPEVLEKIAANEVVVPNVLNMPLTDAIAVLKKKQIQYRCLGQGSYIFDQVPKPGVKINKDTKVLLYFDPEEQYDRAPGAPVVLPDFSGMSLRKVDQMMTELGLKLEAQGVGVAVSQVPSPGMAVFAGETVRVSFQLESPKQ